MTSHIIEVQRQILMEERGKGNEAALHPRRNPFAIDCHILYHCLVHLHMVGRSSAA